MRRRRFVLVSLLLVGLAIGTAIGAFRDSTRSIPKSQNHRPDKSLWPLTDYSASLPADPEKALKRRKRNKGFNKSEFRVHPDDPSENTTIVDAMDPKVAAIPAASSSEIFIGTVAAAQAFVTDDGTGVYSEFSVTVSRVYKTDSNLSVGCLVDLQRLGGRVRFPAGKVHWYSVDKQNMPQVGARYVFFVTRDSEHESLQIITAYELKNGKIEPLDELPQFRRFERKDETEFLNALQLAITAG